MSAIVSNSSSSEGTGRFRFLAELTRRLSSSKLDRSPGLRGAVLWIRSP